MEQIRDVYNLINSKAIAEHCRKIQHKFNTEELAVLIFRNRRLSIEEKIKQYKKLIANYPDMEVIERINCKHYNSVKEMIQNEINRLETLIEDIKKPEEDVIYTYVEYNKSTQEYDYRNELRNARKTFEEVYNLAKEYIKEYEDTLYFKIKKHKMDETNHNIVAEYNVNGTEITLINIIDSDNNWLDIDNICLNIPVPFKRGDILVSKCDTPFSDTCLLNAENLFVLDWVIVWRKNFDKYLKDGNCDSSDMGGNGYFMRDDETMDFILEHQYNYDSWEYYQGELTGRYRVLKTISSLLKDEINIELFVFAYEQIKNETHSNRLMSWFTEEGLRKAGFTETDIKHIKDK